MTQGTALPMHYRQLNEAAQDVRQLQGSAPTQVFDRLLAALEDSKLEDLATVSADALARHQGALAQLRALRSVLAGDDNCDGRA